jgi:micrococcal nuclease
MDARWHRAKRGCGTALVLVCLAGQAVAQAVTPAPYEGPAQAAREGRRCTVRRISDGDTFECTQVGRVRLIGMDTPELSQPPYGRQAAEALERLIPAGTVVLLEPDVTRRDRYDRTLAHVWRGDTLVNWVLVREGWAVLLTIPPNVQYADWLEVAQARAREERRGLWGTDAFRCPPQDARAGRCR